MKKILVPIDFSKFSQYAVDTAVVVAKGCGAEIDLLHVIEPVTYASLKMTGGIATGYSTDNAKLKEEAIKEISPKMDHWVEKTKKAGLPVIGKISTESKGLYMDVELVTEYGADLIILGTKGEKEFVDDMLVGSNTLKIIQEALCPVLVVREKPTKDSIKKVMYATQFAETDKTTFDELIQFFPSESTTLQIVTIVTKSDFKTGKELLEQKDAIVKEFNIPKHDFFIYPENKPAEGIASAADYLEADIILLPNKGKKGIELWVKGSVTETLLKKTSLPVMTHNMTHRHDIMG